MPKVAIAQVHHLDDQHEIRQALYGLLETMRPAMSIPAGGTVLIKVNLCYIKGSETGVTVDPLLAKYLAEWFLQHFDLAEVIIAEADATHLSADIAFKVLGWQCMFASLPKVRLLNLSRDETQIVKVEGLHFKEVRLSKTYMEADYLISFAKLKTHTTQLITGAMKNLFGALPEKIKRVYHPYLPEVICDLVKARPPDLCLVDGLIAHEGMGPVHGMPRALGLILAGDDVVATDHACARVMGMNPQRVPHLRLALRTGLGSGRYEVLGCQLNQVKTKLAFLPRWRQMYLALKAHQGSQ